MTEEQLVWFLGAEFGTEAHAEAAREMIARLPERARPITEPDVIDLTSNYMLLLDIATSAWLVGALRRASVGLLDGIAEDLEAWLHAVEPAWRRRYLDSEGVPTVEQLG